MARTSDSAKRFGNLNVRSAACFYRALRDRLTVGDVAELQSCADRLSAGFSSRVATGLASFTNVNLGSGSALNNRICRNTITPFIDLNSARTIVSGDLTWRGESY